MEKILALLSEIKGYFTGINAALAKLTHAEELVKAVEAELAQAKADIVSRDEKITSLTGELEAAKSQSQGFSVQITTLQAEVEKERKRATETIAAQGLPSDRVPSSEPGAVPSTAATAPGLNPKLKGMQRLQAAFSEAPTRR